MPSSQISSQKCPATVNLPEDSDGKLERLLTQDVYYNVLKLALQTSVLPPLVKSGDGFLNIY